MTHHSKKRRTLGKGDASAKSLLASKNKAENSPTSSRSQAHDERTHAAKARFLMQASALADDHIERSAIFQMAQVHLALANAVGGAHA